MLDRRINPTRIVSCFVVFAAILSGCASQDQELKLTSVGQQQSFREDFTRAYCRRDSKGEMDVVLLDSAAEQTLAGQPCAAPVRQIMHIHVLWTPSREMKAVASNASIKWYVIDTQKPTEQLEYSGTGFVSFSDDEGSSTVSIRNALLKPSNNSAHLADPVGTSRLEGSIVARTDNSQVRRVLDDLHVGVAASTLTTPDRN
ncbi:MAG TPA: hypothetical protein VH370_12945 [Humisphaera sp.]|nr:hypothetical protein [Humisphaera sp.]